MVQVRSSFNTNEFFLKKTSRFKSSHSQLLKYSKKEKYSIVQEGKLYR